MTDTKVDLFTVDREELTKIVSEERFIKSVNHFFLLALPKVEEKTKGGLYLSQQSIDNSSVGNNVGRIVSIGGTIGVGRGGAYDDLLELSVGDYVGYNPHVGLPISHDNEIYLSISDEAIRTKVNDISKHTDGIFKTYSIKGVN